MLNKTIRSGSLDLDYSREHNASSPDMLPAFPNGPYFVPAVNEQPGMWVRLVFERNGKAGAFVAIGTLVSATATEAVVEPIAHERGPAPADFDTYRWRAVLRKNGDAWDVAELGGTRDFEKRIGPLRKAIAEGAVDDVAAMLDEGVPVDFELGYDGPMLVHAAKHGQGSVIELLIARGAKVDVRSPAGTLYEVARRGKASLELLATLRAHGAKVPEKPAAAPATEAPFAVGADIVHPKLGPGKVVSTEGAGDTMKVTVAFVDGSKRTLVAKFLAPRE